MAREIAKLELPGRITSVGWKAPDKELSKAEWLEAGKMLRKIEGAVQWWIGDWWAYGTDRQYGDGHEIAEKVDIPYASLRVYGVVARRFELFRRLNNLSFGHHASVASIEDDREQDRWLKKATKGDGKNQWSVGQLRAAIMQSAAVERTKAVEFNAKKLGKNAFIYADPAWRYEFPPMGGTNRSIENHYPTMTIEDVAAMSVGEIAHENSLLFLWATAPLLAKIITTIIPAWGFEYVTNAAWDKEIIGTGYWFRNQHELLLVCKRGEFPPPPIEARYPSVFRERRRAHSEKPDFMYEIIEHMYPDVDSKVELFGRPNKHRPRYWKTWGNDVGILVPQDKIPTQEAAE